jgi:predicted dinucleotide-binding enzyme
MKPSRRDVLKGISVTTLTVLAFAGRTRAAPNKRKIGMIGSGNVGSSLGRVWARAGHQVMFSSRNLAHDKALAAQIGANARAGTPREAAAFGDVLVFAVPYGALPELGKTLADSIKGKVVIDTCNPFPHRDGRGRGRRVGAIAAGCTHRARLQRGGRVAHGQRT